MIRRMKRPVTPLKRLMPKTLFGRAFLILVLPVVLVQLVAAYIFYEKHWASVTRHLSASLAGEIAAVVERWHREPEEEARQQLILETFRHMGLQVTVEPPLRIGKKASREVHFPVFEQSLRQRIDLPFAVRYLAEEETLIVLILAEDAMLRIEAPEKRLASSTTVIFMGWMLGSALILLLVAMLFLRNQIRPIVRLADAAEKFGKGQESPGFRPSGALEVRQAAKAFLDMRARIRRQVEGRTEMLAGISHDLRTPLTRMRLQLAMLSDAAAVESLQQDVSEMEHMVEEYLAFARGEEGEQAASRHLPELMERITAPYVKNNQPVHVGLVPELTLTVKPRAVCRAIRNLIDNALAYGDECWVEMKARRRHLILMVDDDGPGIPPEDFARAFQAFERLDKSRNRETGGAGLGLTIVRDIIHAHGGNISLEPSHHGGLRVVVELPL